MDAEPERFADEILPRIPMDRVIANELEILGSHGMQAHRYPEMMAMIAAGTNSGCNSAG